MLMGFPGNHFVKIFIVLIVVVLSDVGPTMSCLESERQALLMFKGDLVDESNRLGSWVDVDGGSCCEWFGVSCNNFTGQVIGLHLQGDQYISYIDEYLKYDINGSNQLRGTINPSLLKLKHLMRLNLSWNDFGGTQIPPFLGLMVSLEQLDLSNAGFGGKIPPEIGNLTSLDYLGLAEYSLYSDSLQWISHLSLLRHLDLSYVNLSKARDWLHSMGTITCLSELILTDSQLELSVNWSFPSIPLLNNLSSLVVLDLSLDLFGLSSIPKWIFHLHNVKTLDLSYCNFQSGPIPEGLRNLTSLRSLDLSANNFNSSIPSWLYKSDLEFLSLERNSLQGVISSDIGNLTSLSELWLGGFNGVLEIRGKETLKSIGQLCHLKHLGLRGVKINQDVVDIFYNLFSSCSSNALETLYLESAGIFGSLTNVSFQKFKSLVSLSLKSNSICGSIPASFGKLQFLKAANFGGNMMVGAISEAHFEKLGGLKFFLASGNKLDLKVSPSWIPPFQLLYLELSSWQLGRGFPRWLLSQKNIEHLEMSGCRIEGPIPKTFWNMCLQFKRLILSNNQLRGEVPIFSSSLYYLDLSNNSFESISKGFWNFSRSLTYLNLGKNQIVGEMPNSHRIAIKEDGVVDLRSNKFHGQLPQFSNLAALDLSDNYFSGSLSYFLCDQINETKRMQFLNLANNFLSGEIPNCWHPWKQLLALKLNNNYFTGRLPNSMENLSFLESLHLRNNNLVGGLPSLLRNWHDLTIVDLAENQLQGEIPSWISHTNMKILSLRSNKLHGKVPHKICALSALQILDLANNNLSGHIPRCIKSFIPMVTGDSVGNSSNEASIQVMDYLEYEILVIKGRVMEYDTTLNLVRIIDFSNNFFTGKIPDEVTTLVALQSLNLSQNILSGEIPPNIGAMKLLESLDLSLNKLVGEIPSGISSLNFLNHLNLSSNNLTGRIPSSTQLQSFDASSFSRNDLCGPPLASCDEKHTIPVSTYTDGEAATTYVDMELFFESMGFGFFFGFWGFLFPLFCNRQWRLTFFSFLDTVGIFMYDLVN